MKRTIVVVGLLTFISAATALAAPKSIKNSKHNLSSGNGLTDVTSNTNQICVFCHTPHNASVAVPLWNRNNPTATNFTLYSSTTMKYKKNATGFSSDSISLQCMSCHDGATAIGAVTNLPADRLTGITVSGNHITGSGVGTGTLAAVATTHANLGTNISTSHPVNFNVDPSVTHSYITTPTAGDKFMGGNSANGGVTSKIFPLFSNTRGSYAFECATCHSVHDDQHTMFLRTTIDGSKLCLGCHIK